MKIKPLEKDLAGRYDLYEVPEKINEIINFLNNSFITNDPDTVYGEVGGPIKVDTPLFDISCDRLTPLVNEETCTIAVDHIEDLIIGKQLDIATRKCPRCGASHYSVGPSSMTCVYYPPVYKDGININPDRNTCTTQYECCNCGHVWEETT